LKTVGRTEVAQGIAGAAQTHQRWIPTYPQMDRQKATEVPAVNAFSRSGLHVGE
jgi:hypothetical protein